MFTLDFGDYQDQYYSVQTTEGEQISALIAGYIDIILKRRTRKERFGEDGNEEEAMEESFISPGRAIEIHGLPQTLKKAKPDSLAKPALLRNSGGKCACKVICLKLCIDNRNIMDRQEFTQKYFIFLPSKIMDKCTTLHSFCEVLGFLIFILFLFQ